MAGVTLPCGGHPAPRSPGMPPPGTPQDGGHSSGDTPLRRHQQPWCSQTQVLGTRDAPRGRPSVSLPPRGQMGPGGPGHPLPPPSCHLGQGGEGLSALARVPISAISTGWGQGAAGRPTSPTPAGHRHAMPGCAGSCGQRHSGQRGSQHRSTPAGESPAAPAGRDRAVEAWPGVGAPAVAQLAAPGTRQCPHAWLHPVPHACPCPVLCAHRTPLPVHGTLRPAPCGAWCGGVPGAVGHAWQRVEGPACREAAGIPGMRSSWAAQASTGGMPWA